MAIHHFGTDVDSSVFVEVVPSSGPASPEETDAPQRPARGTVLSVRNASTQEALTDIVLEDNGYWSYATADIPLIEVSADNFQTFLRVRSAEAMDTAATGGLDVQTALNQSSQALDTANEALTVAQNASGAVESVNGKTGSVILTASDVGARSSSTAIPAGDITGLAAVATSGAYTDLSGKPPTAIPLTDKGAINGVAKLDADGDVVNSSGTKILGGGGTGAVSSVNSKTGDVVLTASDVGAAPTVHGHVTADVTGLDATLASKAPTASPSFTGTVSGITKSMVGLANVDNTSDLNKPVSTATTTALAGKANTVHSHVIDDITSLTDELNNKIPASAPIDLTELAVGGGITVFWDAASSSWKYGGNTITNRPTSRTDVVVNFVGGSSANPPGFGVAGVDLWFKQVETP